MFSIGNSLLGDSLWGILQGIPWVGGWVSHRNSHTPYCFRLKNTQREADVFLQSVPLISSRHLMQREDARGNLLNNHGCGGGKQILDMLFS